jgi:ABC-type dipeptide/oligopeptide/nickel transport system ATPase component
MLGATQSGFIVTASYKGSKYEIEVAEAVRGIDIHVDAKVIDGVWRISRSGKELTITSVAKLVPKMIPKMMPKPKQQ